jgi:hypothetical protein
MHHALGGALPQQQIGNESMDFYVAVSDSVSVHLQCRRLVSSVSQQTINCSLR